MTSYPVFFALSALSLALNTAVNVAQANDGAMQDIEVIEVYAQKRLQRIQDVSVAVTSINGAALSEQRIKDTTELASFSPNVKISQNAAEGTPPAINIRGVGLIDYNTSNTSPVSFYIDDVVAGSANNQIVNLFDMEQVEVLRGPQGTLFGRNSTGGAIILRSTRPDSEFGGYITAGLANNDHQTLEGAINLPLTDDSAARFAFSHQDYDYSTNNLLKSSPEAGMRQDNYRFLLSSDFGKLDVLLKAHLEDWSGIVQPVGSIGLFKNPATKAPCSVSEAGSTSCFDLFGYNSGSNDFYDVKVNNNSPHKTDSKGLSLNLTGQLTDNTSLISVTSWDKLKRQHAFNCDGSPSRLCEGNLGLENQVITQELRLHHQLGEHYLIAGAFWLDESIVQDNYNDIFRDLRGVLSQAVTFIYDNQIDVDSSALFAQYDYRFSPATTFTVGLRYTAESTDYQSITHLNVGTDPNDYVGLTIPFYQVSGSQDDNKWSGKLAVNHQLDSNNSVYYSFSNGFKSGGYNGGFLSSLEQAQLADYGAETLNAHEVGAKLTLLDQDLAINMAAFYYDYQDQQVFMNQASTVPNTPPLQLLENVGSSTIYGSEIELFYTPTAQLYFQLGLGYLPEANFDKFIDPTGRELTDNRLPFTSKWNISGLANYEMPLLSHNLVLQLNFDYQSDYYFDQNENPYAEQTGYTLWNGFIRYESDDWDVSLWGKNLFGQHYSNLKFDLSSFLGMLEDFKGEGRRYGMVFQYHF